MPRLRLLAACAAAAFALAGCDKHQGFGNPGGPAPDAIFSIPTAGTPSLPWYAPEGLFLGVNAGTRATVVNTTTRVSTNVDVTLAGVEGDGESTGSAAASLGRFAVFLSTSTDLTGSGGGTMRQNAFVRDLTAGTTELISTADGGGDPDADVTGAAISGSGRFVAFATTATNILPGVDGGRSQIYVVDRDLDTIQIVSGTTATPGDGDSEDPYLSADGRYVAFVSSSTNLVADDTAGERHVFVFDRTMGTTRWASMPLAGPTDLASCLSPTVAGDGDTVAFSALAGGGTIRQIFVSTSAGGTVPATAGDGNSFHPALSSDGRFVAFDSLASDLTGGDTNGASDVFVYDVGGAALAKMSRDPAGDPADAGSFMPSISGDGAQVAFVSDATNLVLNDPPGRTLYAGPNPFTLP